MIITNKRYFFEGGRDGGKKVRPTMVLLMAAAANHHASTLNLTSSATVTSSPVVVSGMNALPSQRRLAEITEMIHTASLFHDDVIDDADTRRGAPAANRGLMTHI